MKTLTTLIKVHQQKLDILRRQVGSFESQIMQLQALDTKLESDLANEIALAERETELSAFFGDYISRIRQRQARLRQEVAQLEEQLGVLRDAVRLEYGEQLKYEKILEARQEEAKKLADKKEAAELDEIAGQHFAARESEI